MPHVSRVGDPTGDVELLASGMHLRPRDGPVALEGPEEGPVVAQRVGVVKAVRRAPSELHFVTGEDLSLAKHLPSRHVDTKQETKKKK